MTARLLRRGATAMIAAALMAAAMAGCQEEQLKQEVINLQTRLRLSEAEKADLAREKTELTDENSRLKSDLAGAQQQLVDRPEPAPPPKGPDFGPGVEVTEDERGITVTLPGAILFDSGKVVLKAGSKTTLSNIAAVIQRDYAGRIIRVEGHTDNDPIRKSGWKDNWELSCERALAVVRHLVSRGIDAKQIYAAGFGSFAPRGPNTTAAGKAKNRRVQVVITR